MEVGLRPGHHKATAIERDRARIYFVAYSAAMALYFVDQAFNEVRAGRTKTFENFDVPDEAIGCGFHEAVRGVNLHVPPNQREPDLGALTEPLPASASVQQQMWHKLKSAEGRALYHLRQAIVEPVFAQIKHIRGFRQFLLRGLAQVEAEWLLVCLTHNLLKLFRATKQVQML